MKRFGAIVKRVLLLHRQTDLRGLLIIGEGIISFLAMPDLRMIETAIRTMLTGQTVNEILPIPITYYQNSYNARRFLPNSYES